MPRPTGLSATVHRLATAIIARATTATAVLHPIANLAAMVIDHHVVHVLTGVMHRRAGTARHQHRAGVIASRGAIGHRLTGSSATAGRTVHHVRVMARAASGHAAPADLPVQDVHSVTSHAQVVLAESQVADLVTNPVRAGMAPQEVARRAVVLPVVVLPVVVLPVGVPRANPATRHVARFATCALSVDD
jgi:hypothetical protein